MAYNIKQITNYDIESYPTIDYTIVTTEEKTVTIPYIEAITNSQIIKLGYCCEPKGFVFPIFINTNDGKGFREIKIGKTGMYEMQPETWQDINSEDKEVKTTDVVLTSVRVPAEITFTLDYVINS